MSTSEKIDVLNDGYVRLIEDWGKGDAEEQEAAIIEAARQSTAGAFRGWEKDERLLRYLYTHKHSTPFEFAGCTIEIQAPLFVLRQWHRHRTQSYAEASARYIEMPLNYYLPSVERVMNVDEENKQAGSSKDSKELTKETAELFIHMTDKACFEFATKYKAYLANGIPKELARINMPVAFYSRMRASANLRNWLAFLTLRQAPDAQWEIRQFADAVGQIIEERFPRTWQLFVESKQCSTS